MLFNTVGGFEEPAEQIFEGFAHDHRRGGGDLDAVLDAPDRGQHQGRASRRAWTARSPNGGIFGLAVLAFTAVIREGIETALFLMGQATAAGTEAMSTLIGALIGLLIAVGIGYGLYRGARVINLRTFFQWTGIALIFIAAGLLSHGIHEFIEAGWITVGTSTAFDISAILPARGRRRCVLASSARSCGRCSATRSTPEWITFIAWLTYVVVVLTLYLRPVRPSEQRTATREQTAVGA